MKSNTFRLRRLQLYRKTIFDDAYITDKVIDIPKPGGSAGDASVPVYLNTIIKGPVGRGDGVYLRNPDERRELGGARRIRRGVFTYATVKMTAKRAIRGVDRHVL